MGRSVDTKHFKLEWPKKGKCGSSKGQENGKDRLAEPSAFTAEALMPSHVILGRNSQKVSVTRGQGFRPVNPNICPQT